MCKIRLIIKNSKGNVINDRVAEVVSDKVNIVDKPFYAICSENEDKMVLEYNFMDNNEDIDVFNYQDIELKYGGVSGRIFSFKLPKTNNFEDTTIFRIEKELFSEKARTERFKSTFEQFITISRKLITEGKSYLS